jgi:hypothetical protein
MCARVVMAVGVVMAVAALPRPFGVTRVVVPVGVRVLVRVVVPRVVSAVGVVRASHVRR